jgi:phosphatidylglycerophosphatase C
VTDAAAGGIAAFDFDGTLTSSGSVWRYLVAMAGWRSVARAGLALSPRLAYALAVGGTAADGAKEALFARTLAGLDAGEARRRSADFGLDHYRRHTRADMRDRVAWHRDRGHKVVVVSASPELYVRPVGDLVGADAVLATRLAVDDEDRLTGRYDGRNCRGEEKATRLRAWVDDQVAAGVWGEDRPTVWAYGNSAGDRRLLAAADVGVDVGRLGRVGKLRRFPRLVEVQDRELRHTP